MIPVQTIIGYLLFALSEILPILPIPANGFLHSFFIGLKNSIKNDNTDVEMAQYIIKNPDNAKITNTAMSNSDISNSLNILINSGYIIPYVQIIKDNPRLQYIITLLNNHKDLISNIELSIENTIFQKNQNTITQVNQQISQNNSQNNSQNTQIDENTYIPQIVQPTDNINSQNLISNV